MVIDQADDAGVIAREVLEIQLIDERDQGLATAAAFDDQKAIRAYKAEAARVIGVRIADRLQPGVAVGHKIAVVVEAGAHVAEVIPDALGRDEFTGVCVAAAARGDVVPAERERHRVEILLWHLAVVVRPDLVGHRRDLIAHPHRAGDIGAQRRGAVGSRGPQIVLKPEIVAGLHAAGHSVPGIVELSVGGQPVFGDAAAGGDVADVAGGVVQAGRAAGVGQ